jgi:hypothetical protein
MYQSLLILVIIEIKWELNAVIKGFVTILVKLVIDAVVRVISTSESHLVLA